MGSETENPTPHESAATAAEERRLIAALRSGDERVFMELVRRYQRPLLRLARTFVPSQAVAEEVVQETWLGVLQGIDRFEGRSSLRTWIFRILVNRAKTRGERERRTVPFSSLVDAEVSGDEPGVDADRFRGPGDANPGLWAAPPSSFGDTPESRLLAKETTDVITEAIDALPPAQRAVVSLRDVAGWSSADVREELGLSEVNQRVLLHRGRSKVRRALEAHLS